MTKTRAQQQEQAEAISRLQDELKPGDTLYTKVEHVSRSGMMRVISVYVIGEDREPWDISWLVARAIGLKVHQRYGGVTVGGCGMDMGFAVVYNLSRTLFPTGFECIGEGETWGKNCPSNDHSNGDRDYTPHHHDSGGYALRQRWL